MTKTMKFGGKSLYAASPVAGDNSGSWPSKPCASTISKIRAKTNV